MTAELPRIFGPYVLLKKLGQGAMGDVHLARPLDPKRGVPTPLVVKRLHGELSANPTFISRFVHESKIAISVDDTHVAKVFDAGAVGETLYIGMEFVAGWPLSRFLDEIIESKRHASIASIIDLFAGGLEGLAALHGAVDLESGRPLGIVHRDISPKNLMVGEDGLMRIIDLGLGKSNLQDWKTRTGVVMGSVGYMPPEQVIAQKVDHRADLYAFGVVLFETLALKQFIKRGQLQGMLRASLRPVLTAPSEYRDDVPKSLDAVVLEALQPEPAKRFQSAAEFAAALRAVMPDATSRGGMVTLLGDLFGASLDERRDEIRSLLAMPLPGEGAEQDRTVVFAQARGLRPFSDADLRAATAATLVPTEVKTVAARRSVAGSAAVTAVDLSQPLVDAIIPDVRARRGVPVWMFAVAMAAMLGIGVTIGSGMFRPPPEQPAKPVVSTPAVAQPDLRATEPATEPQPEPEPEPEVAQKPAPVVKPRPAPAVRQKRANMAAAPAHVETSPDAIGNEAARLLKRAGTLRSRFAADAPEAREIDALRIKISMETGATDLESAASRLRALDAALDRVEHAAP